MSREFPTDIDSSQVPHDIPVNLNTEYPNCFKEMFDPNESDTALQRLAKWYFKPRGKTESTIKILKMLQVHQFQKVPKVLSRFFTQSVGRYQSIYTIKDSGLSSLIDYGANQSVLAETMHIGALGTNIAFGVFNITTDNESGLLFQGACGLINIYTILAQRYSRARCERVIDASLGIGKTIDMYEYNNRLNLNLPQRIK